LFIAILKINKLVEIYNLKLSRVDWQSSKLTDADVLQRLQMSNNNFDDKNNINIWNGVRYNIRGMSVQI